MSGVEIKPGTVREVELFPGHREQIHHLWFRRPGQTRRAEPDVALDPGGS
jgi:hypothetical protein